MWATSGNVGHLVEGIDHAGDLEIAPRVAGPALQSLIKQLRQRLLTDQGGGGDCRHPADQTVLGVTQKILGHGVIAKAVGNAEVDMRIEGTGENDFFPHVDSPFCLAQAWAGPHGNNLFSLNGDASPYDAVWSHHQAVLQDDVMRHVCFPLFPQAERLSRYAWSAVNTKKTRGS